MTFDLEQAMLRIATLEGSFKVLEKQFSDLISNQLIDIKLRCINAEAHSVKSVEMIQQIASEFEQGGAEDLQNVPSGVMDIRGGRTVSNMRPGLEEDSDA